MLETGVAYLSYACISIAQNSKAAKGTHADIRSPTSSITGASKFELRDGAGSITACREMRVTKLQISKYTTCGCENNDHAGKQGPIA